MEDVALRAGVSRPLVSIVFRDQPGASDETRARVRAAAAEIGYRPDTRAQLLSDLGDHAGARAANQRALALTHNPAEQQLLRSRLALLDLELASSAAELTS